MCLFKYIYIYTYKCKPSNEMSPSAANCEKWPQSSNPTTVAPWLPGHAMPPGWFGSAASVAVSNAVLLQSPLLGPYWSPPSMGRAASHVYLNTRNAQGRSQRKCWDLWMLSPKNNAMYKIGSASFPCVDIAHKHPHVISYRTSRLCWQKPASFIAYNPLTPFWWLSLSPTVVMWCSQNMTSTSHWVMTVVDT